MFCRKSAPYWHFTALTPTNGHSRLPNLWNAKKDITQTGQGVINMSMFYKRGHYPLLNKQDFRKLMSDKEIPDRYISDVMEIIYGSRFIDDDITPPYVICKNHFHTDEDATFIQRLNRLWIIPLYLVFMPFQWLFCGNTGFNHNSRLAVFLSRLTGIK
ncbi:TPA: hypothetical protein OGP63_004627 [Escherichia coli]|nr:hypothetical protein [Escherichia coli]